MSNDIVCLPKIPDLYIIKNKEVFMANLTIGKLPIARPWTDWLDVDRIFNDKLMTEFSKKMPAVNISETEKAYQIEVVAPGFLKTDFSVNLEGDLLKISAESSTETTGEEKNYFRREYQRNSFNRTFTLPENAQVDGINAQYEDGILKLIVPKITEQAKSTPKSISVL